MRRRAGLKRFVIGLVPGLTLSACGGVDASRDLGVEGLPGLMAEEDLRIGTFDDPEIGFSRISDVDVDRDGLIYVLEGLERQIRVYAEDGTLMRRIGGSGGGPGEFQSPPRFGVEGDTVWAFDSSANRITLFDRQGTVLSTGLTEGLRVPLPRCHGYVLPLAMRPDGLFTGSFSRIGCRGDDPPTGVQPTDEIRVPRVVFDATGAVADTIGWDESPPPGMWRAPSQSEPERYRTVNVGSRRLSVPDPPTNVPTWLALHDGRIIVDAPPPATAEDAVFTVTRVGLTSDTIYHRRFRYEARPWSSEELDSIAAREARGVGMLEMRAGVPVPVAPPADIERARNALRAEMRFPEFQPPLRRSWVADDEGIWLHRRVGEGPTSRWVLLDPQGLPRGELELPSSVRVLWNRGDVFWASVADSMDVPWLVRYRIRA